MKIFNKGTIEYKIIIALIIVILFNFVYPNISSASVGGILFEPIKDLLLVIADGMIGVTQSMLFGLNSSFLTINYEHDWIGAAIGAIAGVVAGAACIVIGIVGTPFTGGVSLSLVIAGVKIAATAVVVGVGTGLVATYLMSNALPERLMLPMFAIGPGEIFKNQIALLDVNFFKDLTDQNNLGSGQSLYEEKDGNGEVVRKYIITTSPTGQQLKQISSTIELRPVISKWYYAIRNLAIVALLSILIYIGIRILISSSADDKAKYKQRLVDWIVAMCLLFFMHYIMAFAVSITEEISSAIVSLNDSYSVIIGRSEGDNADDGRDLNEYEYEIEDGGKIFDGQVADELRKVSIIRDDPDGGEQFVWPTNEMGAARIQLQLEPAGDSEDDILIRQFGYTVIYLALVMYTMLFLFRYLKRLMMLAFLTIIAPLMAMTYPLDKLQDGSAQGFNTWLKEYIFNLLIQPVHLILYTMLIGSAMDLVSTNLIYALVALGFILQAEKILRKFFGFDKASTVAGGSALGGALAMQGINQISRLLGKGGKGGKSGGNSNGKGNNEGKNPKLRTADKDKDTNSLLDSMYGEDKHQNQLNTGATGTHGTPIDGTEGEQTAQQAMLDAYDEGWGTDEWDPHEREAMAREAYADQNQGMNYSADEYAQILRESGYDENEINDMVREQYGQVSSTDPTAELDAPTRVNKNRERLIRGAKSAGRAARYIAPKAARFAARTAVKGTLMGAGAIAGITAGLVSDDFSNVFKYGTAGAGAGLIAGNGLTTLPGTLNGYGDKMVAAAENEYEATHTKDEIEARRNRILDAQALKNPERIKKYQEELKVSKAEAQRIMKEDAQKFREAGVTDDKLIIKAMKADKADFGAERASTQRILLAQMAGRVGDDQKKLKQVKEGLGERGVPKEEIDNYIRAIKDINKII